MKSDPQTMINAQAVAVITQLGQHCLDAAEEVRVVIAVVDTAFVFAACDRR